MQRLNLEQWEIIFGNMEEDEDIEVVWLDTDDEWVLCFDCELFEDGFKSEKEARERLNFLENKFL